MKYNIKNNDGFTVSVIDANNDVQAYEQMKRLFSSYDSEDPDNKSITMLDGTRYSLSI